LNVSISNLINNYEKCRSLANHYGKVNILKNRQPDAVLLTIAEFERLSRAYKKSDHFNRTDIADLIMLLPNKGCREVYTLAQLKNDLTPSKE